MNASTDQERRLVQYLLGAVPPSEQEEIQRRVFTDEGFDQELLATADDLIHAYLAGALSREERSRFETHFLAMPRHRERLVFLRDLLTAVKQVSTEEAQAAPPGTAGQRRASGRWAVAAAVLAAVGVILVLALRPKGREAREATASPQPLPSATPSPDARPVSPDPERPRPNEVRVVRLPPTPGVPIGITLTPSTRVVRVEVPVAPNSPSFDAALRARDGTEVWHAEGLAPPPSGEPLVLTLPAEIFDSDRYVLRVEGESLRDSAAPRILDYSLRVRRGR